MAEKLANLQKSSELINRSDLWVVGTEYDFGNGLYGQRFSGTFPNATGSLPRLAYVVDTNVPASQIQSVSGYLGYKTGGNTFIANFGAVFMNSDATIQTSSNVVASTSINGIRIQVFTRLTFDANPTYNVGILYKK